MKQRQHLAKLANDDHANYCC